MRPVGGSVSASIISTFMIEILALQLHVLDGLASNLGPKPADFRFFF
jgi:hypothetical protein